MPALLYPHSQSKLHAKRAARKETALKTEAFPSQRSCQKFLQHWLKRTLFTGSAARNKEYCGVYAFNSYASESAEHDIRSVHRYPMKRRYLGMLREGTPTDNTNQHRKFRKCRVFPRTAFA